jgi:hypothetical protein
MAGSEITPGAKGCHVVSAMAGGSSCAAGRDGAVVFAYHSSTG